MGALIVGLLLSAWGLFWVITFIVAQFTHRNHHSGGYSGDGDSWVSEDRG